MLVMEFVKDHATREPWMEATAAVTAETVKRGVITIRAGLYSNCVRFLPPLDIPDPQLDEALDVVEESVGQVAKAAGVTVRTLHHYDEIGLLSPSGRSAAGYRRYDDADLDRLQLIRYYRELGFPLDEITAILDDPASDPTAHLRRQHELLTGRIGKLQDMVAAIELAMEARRMNIKLTPEERFEVFGDHDPDQYADEARVLVLRPWATPAWTFVAAVARTGLITTVTVTRTPVGAAPAVSSAARLLAGAVNGVCTQPDAGDCVTRPPGR